MFTKISEKHFILNAGTSPFPTYFFKDFDSQTDDKDKQSKDRATTAESHS
jgi:hypothetical protein